MTNKAEFDAKIMKVELKSEKDKESGESFRVMIFKGEIQTPNSNQVLGLFEGFGQQLIKTKFSSFDQYEGDFQLECITIEKFDMKNKKVRIGQGKNVEYESVKFITFTMRVKTDMEGNCLKQMHDIFDETVRMTIE